MADSQTARDKIITQHVKTMTALCLGWKGQHQPQSTVGDKNLGGSSAGVEAHLSSPCLAFHFSVLTEWLTWSWRKSFTWPQRNSCECARASSSMFTSKRTEFHSRYACGSGRSELFCWTFSPQPGEQPQPGRRSDVTVQMEDVDLVWT